MKKRRILVVDDEVRMADSLKTLLEDAGYQVDTAYNGQKAIDKLALDPPDLVITDLKMSEIDGYDIMRYIHVNLSMTYLIIITGHANIESAIEAIHSKAFDYITKPFDFDTLRLSVEKAFNQLEIDQFQDDMLALLTHDIRVPLQSVIGYASQIYNQETGKFHLRALEFINNVRIYSERVLALVDNFLMSCKIESGRLILCETQFDFNYFIKDLVAVYAVTAEKRKIKIDVEPLQQPVVFTGDESLLFRAFGNILNNAIKFSPEGAMVTVSCRELSPGESPLEKDTIEVTVNNPGPGIPESDLPTIFDLYKRARNLRTIEGSGLGLFVVRSVIEAHKGKVVVESKPYVSTTFRILLPKEQRPQGVSVF